MMTENDFMFLQEFITQFSIVHFTSEGLLKILSITEDSDKKQNILEALERNNEEFKRLLNCLEKFTIRKKLIFLDKIGT